MDVEPVGCAFINADEGRLEGFAGNRVRCGLRAEHVA